MIIYLPCVNSQKGHYTSTNFFCVNYLFMHILKLNCLLISTYSSSIMKSSRFWDTCIKNCSISLWFAFSFSYQCLWCSKYLILVRINLSIISLYLVTFCHIKETFPVRLRKYLCFLKGAQTFGFYVYVWYPSQIFVFVVRWVSRSNFFPIWIYSGISNSFFKKQYHIYWNLLEHLTKINFLSMWEVIFGLFIMPYWYVYLLANKTLI